MTVAKKKFPHLRDVQSQVLQEPIRRVEAAFAARKERGFGFPRFKKFGQYRSFLFPQFKTNPVRGNKIKLPKIGEMPIVLHRPIPDGFVVKTVRVIKKHSGWYATLCLQIDVSVPEVPPVIGHAIGIDVGLEYFLSTSDGLQVERPRFFAKLQRKLKLLQRRLKRKQKGSNNRAKLIKKIGRVHEQIAAYRLDWQFKQAHKLCRLASNIFIEDIDFRIMAKGFLGKHTLDAGLGQFLNQVLPWVCFKTGTYLGKVDPNGTSQECPDCGAIVKKDLRVRVHECHECGSVKPRDIASSEVIKARGLSGIENVCGVEVAGIWETISSQLAEKQKSSEATLRSPRLIAQR
ncbi:RNA-guided endonuclease InsQ/TnpB family protein [Baaleninema sp.]|uniref:RNA-guided endonuclease InsQ/TnpB family protein n=1 Tax=Baaleninema sp. TaxID=3101197 RepID=UPI003D07555D